MNSENEWNSWVGRRLSALTGVDWEKRNRKGNLNLVIKVLLSKCWLSIGADGSRAPIDEKKFEKSKQKKVIDK